MDKDILLSTQTEIAISAETVLEKKVRVVIIRHGEKPETGDNLSCQGMNRALQLPEVLYQKFDIPDYVYVPLLKCSTSTSSARMFQTITPFAIKHNLVVNSEFDEKDYKNVAADVLQKKGTVLMVWEHSAIPHIAHRLGLTESLSSDDNDFDSIWIIDFPNGEALLTKDKEGIVPSPDCNF